MIYGSSGENKKSIVFSVPGDYIEDQYEIDVGEGGIISSVSGKRAQLTMSSLLLPIVGGINSAGGKRANFFPQSNITEAVKRYASTLAFKERE